MGNGGRPAASVGSLEASRLALKLLEMAFDRSSSLALANCRRLFVEHSATHLGHDARLFAGTLESPQRDVKRLVLSYLDARHFTLSAAKTFASYPARHMRATAWASSLPHRDQGRVRTTSVAFLLEWISHSKSVVIDENIGVNEEHHDCARRRDQYCRCCGVLRRAPVLIVVFRPPSASVGRRCPLVDLPVRVRRGMCERVRTRKYPLRLPSLETGDKSPRQRTQ